jgi:hypothetical protein
VTLKGGKLAVLEPVFFKTNQAIIQSQSYQLLDSVARVLNEHTEFRIQSKAILTTRATRLATKIYPSVALKPYVTI